MAELTRRDRAMGAIVGLYVGDALGLGPHWYYDLVQLRADFGEWISDYAPPKPGRYHDGCQAGDVSQTGQVSQLLLASLADTDEYDESDFTGRLDNFLDSLDGTPNGGRYTDIAMREVWTAQHEGADWSGAASMADTGEAAIRAVMLAARYADKPRDLAQHALSNIRLTHGEPFIQAQSLAFALAVCRLIRGKTLADSGKSLMGWAQHDVDRALIDVFLQPGLVHAAAINPSIIVEPPHAIAQIYGLACQLGFLLPAAYWLASRYENDFETAVLTAVNGGGNNMARACMTGALSGALVGLAGIPERFVDGLRDRDEILANAEKVASRLS
ncbi:ADP-ribosylglycohydrolase family protein [Pseudodesulfovibrio cashew]|uniref:ADP-ribosylglycohydrolase family protein n=1 Tax=Pseudodesulfovibrio cashew TaxID=2678688 RepID=A0A6I6JUK2_9BACT|nr:ADP-ribosylglycohydrolase family protein [Pseudodesulfovibrio cashew]QGY41384.1 ADP-ribosylglycohydrolase family protein [Pseudodesulfovibrio cashew]